MLKKLMVLLTVSVLVLMSCGGKQEVPAAAAQAPAAVSDGSEDLVIDYQVSLAGDESTNHFNWKGNVRYMAAEDSYDAASGASAMGSTHLFMMYLYDVEGKETMGSSLRGLFLYGVNGKAVAENDNLNVTKNSDGTIVIQYVHRGTAYRFTTDSKGILSLPGGKFESRKIGTPQELEAEFTSDGTAQGVDFNKVFTKDVQWAGASKDAMYLWDGDLKVALENDVLSIKGVLTAVKQ